MRALSTVLFVLALAATARADDRETRATEIFKRGAAAYAKGDFFIAAQAFEEANAVLPAGAALYNAALAWEGAREDLKAAIDFAMALDMGLVSAAQLEDAQKRLTALDAKLAAIDLSAPGARVLLDNTLTEPGHIRLIPGDHRLRATFDDGRSSEKSVTLAPGATLAVVLEPPPKEAPPPPPPKREPLNVLRIAGITAGSAAVVGVAVGLGIGITGQGARDDYVTGGRIDPGLRDKAVSLQTAANVTFIVSAVLGATGIGLFTWSLLRKPSPEAAFVIVPGFVSGTF